jgi:hypothetical protein
LINSIKESKVKSAFSIILVLSLILVSTTVVSAGTNNTTIYSDTSVTVYGPLQAYAPPGSAAWGSPVPAVVAVNPGPWPTLDPASWISNTTVTEGNILGNTWRFFRKTVNLCAGATNISGTINATSDNAEEVYVNGVLVGSDGEVQGSFVDDAEWNTIQAYPYQVAAADTLTFDFIVRNYALPPGSIPDNPTGLIFNISISYDCPPINTPTPTPTRAPINTPTMPAVCTPGNPTIYSDTNVAVYGPLEAYAPPGSAAWDSPVPAVVAVNPGPWPTLDPASWISNTTVTEGNILGNTWRLFRKTVHLGPGAFDISGTINATSDNAEEVYVNGVLVGSDGEVQGSFVDDAEWNTIQAYPYQVAAADTLTFDFIVRNYALPPGSIPDNPTGLIFNISISYNCPTSTEPTNTPTQTPTPAAELGQLKVCEATGTGVTKGQFFTVRAGNTDYFVPAGYCVLAGQYPLNTQVHIKENLVSGYFVERIDVAPNDRTVSSNLSLGETVVKIGSGITEVSFRNANSTSTSTKTPAPAASGQGSMQICKQADGGGVSGYFMFRFASQSRSVPVGTCSSLIFNLTPGTLTITEDARDGYQVADIYTIPADRLISKDISDRTVTVTIVDSEDDASLQTVVVFVNRAATTAGMSQNPLEACLQFLRNSIRG